MKAISIVLCGLSLMISGLCYGQPKKHVDIKTKVFNTETKLELPRGLLYAIIKIESGFKPNALNTPINPGVAVSSYGLGQITVDSGRSHCGLSPQELFNPIKNIECAGKILKYYLNLHNDVDRAISSYNAGTPCECDGAVFVKPTNGFKTCNHKRTLKPLRCNKPGLFWNQSYVDTVRLAWVY